MVQMQFKKCRRCGRTLKTEESKERGFGLVCYNKFIKENSNILKSSTIKTLIVLDNRDTKKETTIPYYYNHAICENTVSLMK